MEVQPAEVGRRAVPSPGAALGLVTAHGFFVAYVLVTATAWPVTLGAMA
ncbi:hypothetical protein [Streptomyces lydicus]|nr:hypothetical protein [Streptomyces lydicus]